MKRERELIELSEDEWTPHSASFKPSRVLNPNPPPSNPPPPIESFAFSKPDDAAADLHDIQVVDSSSSDESRGAAAGNGVEDLEDEDAEFEVTKRASTSARGNKFVIDDDDDEEEEDDGGADGDLSENEAWVEEEEETEEDDDVVKKALLKCGKISAELKQELYGTSNIACDQYSEVELDSSAAAKIVTQVHDEVFDFAILCGRVVEISFKALRFWLNYLMAAPNLVFFEQFGCMANRKWRKECRLRV